MKSATKKSESASSAPKVLEQKWGKSAIEAGFTAIPNVVFRKQKALNLKPLDVLILLHLSSHWWSAAQNPWPAKGTLAEYLDVDPRTVQRSIQKMEKLGYVQRILRKSSHGDNLANEYDLRGLVQAIDRLAKEELELRENRAAEDKQRRTTPKVFALLQGGKE